MVDRMSTNTKAGAPRLGGVSEVASELGVSRQQVAKLRQQEDFPLPVATLSVGDVWDLDIISRWANSGLRRKAGRPADGTRSIALGGRFELGPEINSGGFAVVYRARDLSAPGNTQVAVKILREAQALDPGVVARFERELRLMSEFSDPHVMTVLDSGSDARIGLWYAMPLALGSLADELGTPMTPDDVVRVMREICAGLAYIHARGVFHRDLKPANVLRTQQGTWAVADLGLAMEAVRSSLRITSTFDAMGTRFYSAPEQFRDASRVNEGADVYSAGKIMQALLTGTASVDDRVPPGRLQAVILRAIAMDPARRHSNATDLLTAIETAMAPAPTGVWEAAQERSERLRARLEGDRLVPDKGALAELISWASDLDDEDDQVYFCVTLSVLQTPSIRWWWEHDPEAFERVFRVFAELLDGRFGFGTCDRLANYAQRAVSVTGSSVVLQEAITGLTLLGTQHNRWHVRDVVVAILQDIRTDEDAATALEGLRVAGVGPVDWTLGDTVVRTLNPVLRSGLRPSLAADSTQPDGAIHLRPSSRVTAGSSPA